jgi:hypothetical protein
MLCREIIFVIFFRCLLKFRVNLSFDSLNPMMTNKLPIIVKGERITRRNYVCNLKAIYWFLITKVYFVCFLGFTTVCGCIFHSLVAGFASSFSRFLDHTQRRATVGRTPVDE